MDGNLGADADAGGLMHRMLAPAQRILDLQRPGGAIPWFEDGPWDPWNHVECAMALTAIGAHGAAIAAYDHLAGTQRADGAWLGDYGNALPIVDRDFISREPAPAFLDTNFCAYPAVGIAHYLLETGDIARVRQWWPMVREAMRFVIGLQRPDGSISWAFEAVGTDTDDALLAGNASIAKSLDCAIFLARQLGEPAGPLVHARTALVRALRHTPEAFDRRGTGMRFAMDWYYPVLCGVLDRPAALGRIEAHWQTFVAPEPGCLCVRDEPWITVAETCELALALVSLGQRRGAERLFRAILPLHDEGGVFWMGWQRDEAIVWPREQPSWTQAAAILAADALTCDRPGSRILTAPLL